MTREQLDAIRARVERHDAATLYHAPTDLRALLAEVERLTAERDAAFKRGVVAMRETARMSFVAEAEKWQREGDGEMELRYLRLAGDIRTLLNPEDTK